MERPEQRDGQAHPRRGRRAAARQAPQEAGPADHTEQRQRSQDVDHQVCDVVPPWIRAPESVVHRERQVHGRSPAGGRPAPRREQRVGDRPQALDGLVPEDRRNAVEEERPVKTVVPPPHCRQHDHPRRRENPPPPSPSRQGRDSGGRVRGQRVASWRCHHPPILRPTPQFVHRPLAVRRVLVPLDRVPVALDQADHVDVRALQGVWVGMGSSTASGSGSTPAPAEDQFVRPGRRSRWPMLRCSGWMSGLRLAIWRQRVPLPRQPWAIAQSVSPSRTT